MDSLENLREFVSKGSRTQITTLPPVDLITLDLNDLTKLIDAIEEEHEETARALYKSGVEYGLKQGSATLDLLLDHQQDKLAEHGYVKLPVDADGMPIHVGDWITGRWDAKAKVVAVTSDDVYWWEPDGCHWCHAFEVRHHHAPTVEDVLREFAHVGIHIGAKDGLVAGEFDFYADEDSIAKYAKKLRLADNHTGDERGE